VKWSGITSISAGDLPVLDATVSSLSGTNWTVPFSTLKNQPPAANGQSVVTDEDTAKTITLTGGDPDNNPLTFTVVTPPGKGTLNGTAPNLIYQPNNNANGADSFTFIVNDGTTNSSPATVSITINPKVIPPNPASSGFFDPAVEFGANNPSGVWTYGFSLNQKAPFETSPTNVSDDRYAGGRRVPKARMLLKTFRELRRTMAQGLTLRIS